MYTKMNGRWCEVKYSLTNSSFGLEHCLVHDTKLFSAHQIFVVNIVTKITNFFYYENLEPYGIPSSTSQNLYLSFFTISPIIPKLVWLNNTADY